MALVILAALLLVWLSFGTRALRDRSNWPALAAMLLGLVLMARGREVIGFALVGGAAVWLRKPWRRTAPTPVAPPPRFVDGMALADASDLLGVPADADRETILAAHRRLIARNHPDNGGTAGLAARLNAARDLLLKSQHS